MADFALPTQWPSESLVEWIPLILAAIDSLGYVEAWDESDQDDALQRVDELRVVLAEWDFEQSKMIGDIGITFNSALPDTRLWCDGTQYARADYPDLYAALDSAFHVDADNFVVPDLRERVPIGAGGFYQVGDTGGASSHILSVDEMPAHSHGGIVGRNAASLKKIHWSNILDGANSEAGLGNNYAVVTEPSGGGQPHNNMQPYIVCRYWIQAR